jgi:flavin-dependent dehydrogenase
MRYDVVVAGGGPAGCAIAIALARHQITSCIIERGDYSGARPGEMLQPASRGLLERLNVRLDDHRPAYGVSSAWESETLVHNDFFAGTHGDGWLLDRPRFDAALAAAAREAGATLLTNSQATPADFESSVVVDATGMASAEARRRGARKIAYDHLTGVFAMLDPRHERGDGFTIVEAMENGWWYSAFVPDGRIAVAFMTDADIVREQRLNDPERWLAALQATRYTRERTNGAALREPLHVRSAASAILDHVCGDGWLAIGDAASAWDPLSSSGIHKALGNAIDAASAIAAGSFEGYERSVRGAFDDYLATRDRYYALVRRWPESLFWKRRSAAITLDPMATLRTRDASRTAIERIDPRLRIEEILSLCLEPRRAHDVVSACAARHDDAVVIRALQAMLREGVLACV